MVHEWADHQVFNLDDGAILYDVDLASLFRIDASIQAVLQRWSCQPRVDLNEVAPPDRAVLEDLRDLRLLVPAGSAKVWPPLRCDPTEIPLSTMVLEVAQDCNLRCTYCYAAGGAYGGPARLLDVETARRAARYLVEKSGDNQALTLVLFGGEPLLNMPAVKAAVEEAEEKAAALGKKLLVSLTTNGTLLDAEILGFLRQHRVVVSVSLDGPAELHDANRPDAAGRGSYSRILARLGGLLENSNAAVAARVTLTPAQWSRCEEVFDHLIGLGFHEVGIAPASPISKNLLPDIQQEQVLLESLASMARRFSRLAKEGRILPFSNLVELLSRLHMGQTKAIACGAGYGYLAVDAGGEFYPCHRLAGEKGFAVGTLATGVDADRVRSSLAQLTTGKDKMCQSCWARSLCAGGCHYENHLRENTLGLPPGSSCDFIRRWLQIGIELYAELRHAGADGLLAKLEKRNTC